MSVAEKTTRREPKGGTRCGKGRGGRERKRRRRCIVIDS
jgi:hypothetical protein